MQRLKSIDAARGLAEFWVLGFHALVYLQMGAPGGVIGPYPLPKDGSEAVVPPLISAANHNWIRQLATPLMVGQLGVAIFFVVSGFCIHWPAARAGRDFQFRLGYYVKRRFWRLYPTHFVAVCGSMLLAWLLWSWIQGNGLGQCAKVPWSAWWAHFAMLQAQLPDTAQYSYCYNPNLWSLETEFQLYGCYIFLLPLARRFGWRNVLFGTLAISLWWMKYAHDRWQGYGWMTIGQTIFIGHLFSWTIGAYVAECLCRGESPVNAIGWSVFATGTVNVVFVAIPSVPLTFMGTATASAWVLWFLVNRESRRGETFRGCAWLGWWGHRSYSLYLWHAPILRVFIVVAALQAPWIGNNYYYAYGLALVAALACLYFARFSYWAVERHFINPVSQISVVPHPAAWQPQEARLEMIKTGD
jgi:peptidoglycan/LPS O-acetylase OafA/YrhL